ncbi:WSC domain-containing protein [Aspergillus fijiensis CBS 313.89]|uniref:WSC-domain-containing protein n=1 Tax=Aspergillus fijiensis CBS 313.89 TaxID=1448319 RepID=A0A8G1RSK8_9EURO|nr:WSC-domain-containing protein [Aspergillus fijiensis CBS 313.89]RAK78058.1 WSC-domain-containing protein [Aspergillus fijiensis CBS 313.89]
MAVRLRAWALLVIATSIPGTIADQIPTQTATVVVTTTPVIQPSATGSHLSIRDSVSSDPSCPDGWLCDPTSCSMNCAAGTECQSFEGVQFCTTTNWRYCAAESLGSGSWALYGVNSVTSICCHGNAYPAGTQCCSWPGVESSATSAVTSAVTSAAPSISSSSASSSSSSSPATSSNPPTPTLTPQLDTFTFNGCYADSADARLLVADSSEDGSADGMTVEKCIALAQASYWRYAGVEFGSQCFVGNTLHGPDQYATGDCNTPCAGNPTELCGDGGRIQVYEDASWSSPTLAELADAVQQYNATVADARQVIADYKAHMDELAAYLSSTSTTRKRDAATLNEFEMTLMGDQRKIEEAQANTARTQALGDRRLTIGRQLDTFGTETVPETVFEEWGITASNMARLLGNVWTTVKGAVAKLRDAAANNAQPEVDAVAAAAEAETALDLIGVGATLTVASGFFLALATIWEFFHGSGSSGGGTGPDTGASTTLAPTTLATATTTPSATSTTSCTATATSTPIGLLAKPGVSAADFSALVARLPVNPDSILLTDAWQPNFLYVGAVDECTIETLNSNELVESWTVASGSQPLFAFNSGAIPACEV